MTLLFVAAPASARPHNLTTWARYEHFHLKDEASAMSEPDLLHVLPELHRQTWGQWKPFDARWDAAEAKVRVDSLSNARPYPRFAMSVDWDAVAFCESSGDWSIQNGGYSGGLQFTASTWAAYGGLEFAPSAGEATREQQIILAERVLKGQGIGAWPVCGSRG